MLPSYQRRIFYRDTDAGGVVYHAQYLVFFEEARAEWLRSLGIEQSGIWRDSGQALAVSSVKIDFLRPGKLDDMLLITGTITKIGKVTIELAQQAWCKDIMLAEATLKLAYVDVCRHKIVPLPIVIRDIGNLDRAAI